VNVEEAANETPQAINAATNVAIAKKFCSLLIFFINNSPLF
jgi:hypothetical protein